jgi:hypothetical protein
MEQGIAKQPVKINLGGMKDDDFEAYVIGADASGGNSKPVRLKILVKGKGRDNSVVTQTAILSVSGLYKTSPPLYSKNIEDPPPEPEPPPPPGSPPPTTNPSIPSCQADPPPSPIGCVRKLPDLWGNMATAGFIESRTMIITQTASPCNVGGQALNTIKIGSPKEPGYLILDGDYYTNNGIYIYGDVYATGNFDLCASGADFITGNLYVKKAFHPRVSTGTLSIGGSAYFADSVNPNVESPKVCDPSGGTVQLGCKGQLGGLVKIGGNTTIMGPYLAYRGDEGGGSLEFNVGGNLVMGDKSYMVVDAPGKENKSSKKFQNQQFEVQKNAWVKKINNASPIKDYTANSVVWPTFGKDLCLGYAGTFASQGSGLYKDNLTPPFYFRTSGSAALSCSQTHDEWGADQMKELEEEVVYGGSSSSTKSCGRPPVAFDTNIVYKYPAKTLQDWVHKDGKPGSCPHNSSNIMDISTGWSTGHGNLLDELKKCWNNKSSSDLHNGWFVIHIKNQDQFENPNGKPGSLGTGKYIIVYDYDPKIALGSKFLYLPPTGPNATVMLYLPNGYHGTIELAGNETGKIAQLSEYNYFIFSNDTIGQFNTTKDRTLHGNVFMNKCGVINTIASSANPYFYSKGNDAFVQQLMTDSILKNTEWTCKAGSNNPTTPTYTLECTLPPATGTEGTAITQPTVTCRGTNGTVKSNCGFSWTGAPIWAYPMAGTYTVSVSGNSGDCSGKTAICGTLTVNPSSSSVAPSSSSSSSSIVPSSSSNSPENPNYEDEEPWIPISTRLAVKIESKEISKEKVPEPGNTLKLKKSILVMPRFVHIKPGEDISGDKLRRFYSYMPLNGAKRSDTTQSLPTCRNQDLGSLDLNSPAEDVYTCSFPGAATRHSSFYVFVGNNNNLPPAGEGVECKFNKDSYTQGENIKPTINCKSGSASLELDKADFITYGFMYPTNYNNWKSGGYAYFPGIDAEMEGIVTVSGICGGAQETPCEPYLTIKKPTCNIPPGPYYSMCTKDGKQGDCFSIPLVDSPTHSCGDALKYPSPSGVAPPKFNYSDEGDNTISPTEPAWNGTSPDFIPQGHTFASVGLSRKIRMYEISCDGNRLYYGTKTGNGIVCGTIDVVKIGGESGSDFGNSICEDLNLCGGDVPFENIIDNSTVKPTLKQCLFVIDYDSLTISGGGGTILINGTLCTGGNKNCMEIPKPEKKDNGYYIYVQSGAISGSANYKVTSGPKPSCSGRTYSLSCATVPATGTVGAAITPPTVNCGSIQVSTGSLGWTNAPNWSNPALGTYTNISVLANAGNCTGQSINCGGVLTVSALPTITCTLAKESLTQGENIGPPTIKCSTGAQADISQAYFQGFTPGYGLGNWNTTGNAYYGTSQAGSGTIQVSNVKCGGITVSGNTNCGSITVRKPNCSGVSGSVSLNQAITPTASCGNAAKSGTPTFDGGSGWSDNGSGGGSYTSTGNKTVYLSSVTCDGHLISDITNESCGNVTVTSGSRTITCVFSKDSYTIGESVPAPTITCVPDGVLQKTNAVFTATGISPSDLNAWRSGSTSYTSAGTSTIKVSNVNCGQQIPPEVTCTPNPLTIGGGGSGGGGCVAGATEHLNPQSPMQDLGTGAICVKVSKDIAGWNVSNSDGRTCAINGGTAFTPANNTTLSAVPKTTDGYAYINCTAGIHAYFGLSYW